MSSIKRRAPDSGFTIIELLIATTFFSMLLLFVVASFVQINRRSQESFRAKLVQDATRVLLEDIASTIRNYSGQLEIYDDPGDSGNVPTYKWNSATGPSFNSGITFPASVHRICAGSRRIGWNEYNTVAGNANGWGPNQLTREHNFYSNGTTFKTAEDITLLKSDDAGAAVTATDCRDPFDFVYSGSITSALSDTLRIHDLDVTEIAKNGNSYTYKIELVIATVDNFYDDNGDGTIDPWETVDIQDYTETNRNFASDFEQKGTLVPGTSRLIEPICKTGDGAEFCKVIKMEMIASTRP